MKQMNFLRLSEKILNSILQLMISSIPFLLSIIWNQFDFDYKKKQISQNYLYKWNKRTIFINEVEFLH